MTFHEDNLSFEPCRQGQVVGILPSNVPATSQLEASVEGTGQAHVSLVDNAHAGIGKAVQDGRRAVRRPIINDDELEIYEGLIEHAFDRGPQVTLAVENGQEHADQGGMRQLKLGLHSRTQASKSGHGHPSLYCETSALGTQIILPWRIGQPEAIC